jgi:hypothetical protein
MANPAITVASPSSVKRLAAPVAVHTGVARRRESPESARRREEKVTWAEALIHLLYCIYHDHYHYYYYY